MGVVFTSELYPLARTIFPRRTLDFGSEHLTFRPTMRSEPLRCLSFRAKSRNGASGTSDIDGCAARVVARESGDERVNLSMFLRAACYDPNSGWHPQLHGRRIRRADQRPISRQRRTGYR